jgi:hypothetical protein
MRISGLGSGTLQCFNNIFGSDLGRSWTEYEPLLAQM